MDEYQPDGHTGQDYARSYHHDDHHETRLDTMAWWGYCLTVTAWLAWMLWLVMR